MNYNLKLPPLSVRDFYIKLYLKKKPVRNNKAFKSIHREAVQSWKSLEPQDKQIILKKYKEALTIYQTEFGIYLKNVKPSDTIKINHSANGNDKEATSKNVSGDITHKNYEFNVENSSYEQNYNSHSNFNIETEESDRSAHNILDNQPPPAPPAPPNIINPKDLYERLNTLDENTMSYEQLSRLEKRPYQNALLAVKKGYLKKYESYLHSLSDRDLYKHMVDVVNEDNI